MIEAAFDDVRQAPVVAGLRALGGSFEAQHRSGWQLFETLIDAERIGDVIEAQQGGEGFTVHGGVEAGEALNRFQFRGEDERFTDPAVVEGLLAHAIAGEMQHAFLLVPHGKGKHAVEALGGCDDAPMTKGRQHDLGVGVAAKGVAEGSEFGAQILEVVDLAIEDDDEAAIGAVHRLMAER